MFTLFSKLAQKKMPITFWLDLALLSLFALGLLLWREASAAKTVRNTGTVSVSVRKFSDGSQLDIDPNESVTTDNATADYLLQYHYCNSDNDLEYVDFEGVE